MQLFKFKPLLKSTIWGGNKIVPFKGISGDVPSNVGESWEISGVQGDESIIDGGEYDGKNLNELLSELGPKLVGEENYRRFGNSFPLLIKFIDACDDLSIQVHPTDEQAQAIGKPRGKTEMWYVMKSDKKAFLRVGLKTPLTPEEYKAKVADGTIPDALCTYEVKEDDVFYLPAGRIHAIGSGCFLAEIQETSDITYRIFDYNRKDKNGNYRELHTKQATECIDYTCLPDYQTHYTPEKNAGVGIVQCPYFTTSVYDLTEPMVLDYEDLDSFVILIGLKGEATITDKAGNLTTFKAGESILLPATAGTVRVDGTMKFLETFV